MKDDSQKIRKNDFRVRLYNIEVVKSINELMKTGEFKSANELLERAIAIGIEKIYVERGKRKRKLLAQAVHNPEMQANEKLDKIEREIAKVRIREEDMCIMLNSIKAVTASIYNIQRANIKGEPLNVELLDNYGYMSELPEAYREIENNLLKRINRRLGKKNEGKLE